MVDPTQRNPRVNPSHGQLYYRCMFAQRVYRTANNLSLLSLALRFSFQFSCHQPSPRYLIFPLQDHRVCSGGRKKTEWWGIGMVICLQRGADTSRYLCHSLSLASVKSRLVLPFCYRRWRRGVVVSGVRQWTKLTHVGHGYNWDGWPSSGGYTISGCNQPTRSTQPCIPGRLIEYQLRLR